MCEMLGLTMSGWYRGGFVGSWLGFFLGDGTCDVFMAVRDSGGEVRG